MKRYHLVRDEFCEFSNGWVAVAFRPEGSGVANVIVYGDIAHVEQVHGHGGKTRLVPLEAA